MDRTRSESISAATLSGTVNPPSTLASSARSASSSADIAAHRLDAVVKRTRVAKSVDQITRGYAGKYGNIAG
ncbi:MAG TPA: hypothetical protein VGA75_07855, partial [Paracoccaceae bacterium]